MESFYSKDISNIVRYKLLAITKTQMHNMYTIKIVSLLITQIDIVEEQAQQRYVMLIEK
mgnify:CR=1 FL=1